MNDLNTFLDAIPHMPGDIQVHVCIPRLIAALRLAVEEYAFETEYEDRVTALEWKLLPVLEGKPNAN